MMLYWVGCLKNEQYEIYKTYGRLLVWGKQAGKLHSRKVSILTGRLGRKTEDRLFENITWHGHMTAHMITWPMSRGHMVTWSMACSHVDTWSRDWCHMVLWSCDRSRDLGQIWVKDINDFQQQHHILFSHTLFHTLFLTSLPIYRLYTYSLLTGYGPVLSLFSLSVT